ncbi:MAG TPA: GNAT family N-acetyltransferase [Microscillaceae bacterium]|nr:GNAT family N-acetyltransferase [Microscillaceae bacterium]
MNLSITPVTKQELTLLQEIGQSTFVTAFAAMNTPEDMDAYLKEKMNLAQITKEWETPGSDFYFARFEEEIVGYLKLNTGAAQNEQLPESSLEVERIYITAPFQGKKLGQQLLNFAIDKAQKQGLNLVWLGVWERNEGAQRFYKRNGFVSFSKHDFYLGKDQQTDILMKLTIGDQ